MDKAINEVVDNYNPLKIPELKSIYDMMSLKGKTAFITGGAGGLGRSAAAGMAEVGANIVLMDIPEREADLKEHTQAIINRYGGKASYALGDVSNEDDVKRMLGETVKEFGTLDIVFSNAGRPTRAPIPVEVPLEDWKRELDVNITGMMLVDRTSAMIMRDQGHGGSIINTASMSGLVINKRFDGIMGNHSMSYPTTKAAVIHLTKSIAINFADRNIRCNCISPGTIISGLHNEAQRKRLSRNHELIPLGRVGNLNEIMGIVLFLASNLSTYVTGANYVIDGGYTVW